VLKEIPSILTEELKVISKYFITSTFDALILLHPDEIFWALNPDVDYSAFDFSWRPPIDKAEYIHEFGTQTYLVNSTMWLKGYRDINYIDAGIVAKADMFFVDRGNIEALSRFEALKLRYPYIQKTRYLNSWVDTINRCVNRASSKISWILNSELDYSKFKFDYYPNAWQMNMVHVFGTQWSHWGSTFMVNRETFASDTKWIKLIEHLPNLNFVKNSVPQATNCLYDVYVIDHGNTAVWDVATTIKTKISEKSIVVIPYKDSYLETFKQILTMLPTKKDHYIWVCSSVCDYTGFDFSYICDPYSKEQLHVFPSDKQMFGDTFLINVNKLRELIVGMKLLEEYEKIHYNNHQRIKRLPAPVIITEDDSHVTSVSAKFDFPYAVFITKDNIDIEAIDDKPMSLWSPTSKNIIISSTGGTRITVPKEISMHVNEQLYDYPYIIKTARLAKSKPLDIVFLSNDEPNADENYEHLLKLTKGLNNLVTRVSNVSGRVQAYHAAAKASTTPWMFTVFAKLMVSSKFDWNWQPDRLQSPKHYIFHAKNPVNGLVYGHQAIIAYNKKMTLENSGSGLDFTLDSPHEVVEVLSGIANYNVDAWSTWRTAFREAIKLRLDSTEVGKNRLNIWLTNADGNFGEYSISGASDALAYYEEVSGNLAALKLSYEWAWLKTRFTNLYNL
jgi:hypothetical protein